MEQTVIKLKWHEVKRIEGIIKSKDTNLPLNGIYEDKDGTIRYFKNGKHHREDGPAYISKDFKKVYFINGKCHKIDGPAVISSDGEFNWYINGYKINKVIMDNWLTENDIPLDWNIWSNEDKMLFVLRWSDYQG